MDIRTIIVQKVMEALQGRTDEETVGMVQNVLVMQLNSSALSSLTATSVQRSCTS